MGDIDFLVVVLERNDILTYCHRRWYSECLYLLAMLLDRKPTIESLQVAKKQKPRNGTSRNVQNITCKDKLQLTSVVIAKRIELRFLTTQRKPVACPDSTREFESVPLISKISFPNSSIFM